VATVDSIRIYRGIYAGFALAMSEAAHGLQFDELPSSDEIAGHAFRLTREVLESDDREDVPEAQQELTAVLVCLAIIEHLGKVDELTVDSVRPALTGVWTLLGDRWTS
jgi:hypothetical protein